jgi:hypothetical protein
MTETVESYMNITSVQVCVCRWISEWMIDTSVIKSW